MNYKLCASHLPEKLSFDEVLHRESALKAVGTEVYGPVRIIEADNGLISSYALYHKSGTFSRIIMILASDKPLSLSPAFAFIRGRRVAS